MYFSKKSIIIVSSVLAILLLTYFVFLFNKNQNTKSLSLIKDIEIISRLEKNQISKSYLKNNNDFKIEKKIVLTKESILDGQNGKNFKEVYQGLELQDNRYMRVDLINQSGEKGLITVIDFKENDVPKAYRLLLLKASVK